MNPLKDAQSLADTIIGRYPNPLDLPPAGRWHYHQGVFLLGVLRLGLNLEKKEYVQYVDDWTGGLIAEDGSLEFAEGELDALQAANLLFHRLTDDPDGRFRKALDRLVRVLVDFPRTDQGGFWHKHKYRNQQWLDGLYMIGPLCAGYSNITGDTEWLDEIITQAFLITGGALDEESGLLRHGFDRSKSADWVSGDDGRAPEVWGRALGWFPAALLDILDWMPADHRDRNRLEALFRILMGPVLRYRDESSGLWYQVVDKGDDPQNWLETSCSSLFLYAMAKGRRLNLLKEPVEQQIRETWKGLTTRTRQEVDGSFTVDDICIGTGIGSYSYYLERPRSTNDLHGAGTFIMAALETHPFFKDNVN